MVGELEVGAGVREVRFCAAFQVFGLRRVSFSKDSALERVCAGAFSETDLEEFKGPARLWDVGPFAFFGCGALERVELERRPESVVWSAFAGTKVREVCIRRNSGRSGCFGRFRGGLERVPV